MGDKLDLRTKPINRLSVSKYDMKTVTIIAFVAVFTYRLCLAQPPTQQEVLQFERDACKAFLDADVAALERVLTPDFTLTLSNGEVSTRADEINELHTGKVHYDVFENYDMLARLYGNDMAVVLGKTRVKGTADGKPFDRVVQFTDTLIKRDGRWQLAAGHVSRIEK
jgi:ketosteroid isomerase-like protein